MGILKGIELHYLESKLIDFRYELVEHFLDERLQYLDTKYISFKKTKLKINNWFGKGFLGHQETNSLLRDVLQVLKEFPLLRKDDSDKMIKKLLLKATISGNLETYISLFCKKNLNEIKALISDFEYSEDPVEEEVALFFLIYYNGNVQNKDSAIERILKRYEELKKESTLSHHEKRKRIHKRNQLEQRMNSDEKLSDLEKEVVQIMLRYYNSKSSFRDFIETFYSNNQFEKELYKSLIVKENVIKTLLTFLKKLAKTKKIEKICRFIAPGIFGESFVSKEIFSIALAILIEETRVPQHQSLSTIYEE